MIRVENRFAGWRQISLYAQARLPDQQARAHVLIVHGLAEHSGRYQNIVQHLVPRGIAVWGFDLRGHGRSAGRHGHIQSWEEYRHDLDAYLRFVAERQPSGPRFMLGHSLGALIVLEYLLSKPVGLSGAIVSATPIDPAGVAKPHLVALARLLTNIWPTFALNPGLQGKDLSRDPVIAAAYEHDPLVHRVATARWGTECLAALERVKLHPERIQLPLLVLHGGADPINLPAGTEAYFARLSTPDRQIQIYPGTLHEPHNDLDHQQVVTDIERWLERQLG